MTDRPCTSTSLSSPKPNSPDSRRESLITCVRRHVALKHCASSTDSTFRVTVCSRLSTRSLPLDLTPLHSSPSDYPRHSQLACSALATSPSRSIQPLAASTPPATAPTNVPRVQPSRPRKFSCSCPPLAASCSNELVTMLSCPAASP